MLTYAWVVLHKLVGGAVGVDLQVLDLHHENGNRVVTMVRSVAESGILIRVSNRTWSTRTSSCCCEALLRVLLFGD